jgi:transposase InsO family protein
VFKELCTQQQREKDSAIVRIRSDHGIEFENAKFNEYCSSEGIKHEFSSATTPQQNGVLERKNRTLQESAKVMLLVELFKNLQEFIRVQKNHP